MKRQACDGGVRSLDSPELKEQFKGEGRMVPVRAEGGLLTRKAAWSASVAVSSPAQTSRSQSRITNHSPILQNPCHSTQWGFTYPMALSQKSFPRPSQQKEAVLDVETVLDYLASEALTGLSVHCPHHPQSTPSQSKPSPNTRGCFCCCCCSF